MAYDFINQKLVTACSKICREIFTEVQSEIRDYFTFDIRLIGSGDKRLVTQNGNEPFDLDYNLILQKDKKGLIGNPKQIKEIFIARFNRALENSGLDFMHASNSTSVITVKMKDRGKVVFVFDVAIIFEDNEGMFHRLMHDKDNNRYLWNTVPSSRDYLDKYQAVKEAGYFDEFKERYKDLKNKYLSNPEKRKSFSVFLEALNAYCRLWSGK